MRQTICFVPFHPAHLRKNRLLLRHLGEMDGQIDVICVDELYPRAYATRDQLESAGYAFSVLDGGGFHSTRHWMLHVLWRRKLARNVRRLLREIEPALLIVCADNDLPAKAIVRVAKELGVPAILIVDGLAVGRNPHYRLKLLPRLRVFIATSVLKMFDVRGLRGTSGVERVLVMNEGSRDETIRHGVEKSRVWVVGSPEYDDLARKERDVCAPDRNRRLRASLGIGEDRPVVLFAHQSLFLPRTEEQALIRQMMHAVRGCDGVLLVKFHPGCDENPRDWQLWARQEGFAGHEAVFVRDWSPSIEAVRLSAACVTVYSTVALEALVLDTPLILIQYLNSESLLPYGEKYGAAIAVGSPAELRDAIVRTVTDADTRARLRRNAQMALVSELGGFDGRSLERSSEAILDLLRRTSSDSLGLKSDRGECPSGP